jgi:hypothetical protein
VNWRDLYHNKPQAVARDGYQDNNCQDQAGAVAPQYIREHLSMITLVRRLGKQLPDFYHRNLRILLIADCQTLIAER